MTDGNPAGTDDAIDSLTDPDRLQSRDDVAFESQNETVSVEQFERYADADGLAVVGVGNEDGETLLVYNGEANPGDEWMLPFGPVEPGDDWAAVGREWVDHLSGVDVALTGVEAVRRIDLEPEADDDRENRVHEVVFRAIPERTTIDDDPGPHEGDDWHADWFDGIDDERVHDPDGNTGADVRRFFD